MAKSCTRLTSGVEASGSGTSVQTASVSPGANSAIIVAVTAFNGAAMAISGLGLSWTTRINGFQYTTDHRIWVFVAYGSPSAGQITLTYDDGTFLRWSVDNVTGTVSSSPTNTNTATGSGTNTGGAGTTALATLGAFGQASNGTWGYGIIQDGTSLDPGSGFTEVGGGAGLFDWEDATEFKDSNDTSVDMTVGSGAEAIWGMVALEIVDSAGGSSVTKTPTTGNLSLGGLAVLTSAFQFVRIREVLINESGQPIASATNLHLAVWYSGICRGAPDVSLNAQTTDANGTTSWSISTGSLVNGQTIFYVAQDSLSFSNYTAARMIPSYE